MRKLQFWIKERDNPQLGTYYVACGQMTKAEAKKNESALYGYNIMHGFKHEEDYTARLEELRNEGESVQ